MSKYRNETATFDAELANETDKAWLCVIDGDEYWVPKSVGEWSPSTRNAIDGHIEVPVWWAEKNDLA